MTSASSMLAPGLPLSLDACLIITHTQFVRHPQIDPMTPRPNARAYQNTLRNLMDTQFDRELEEDEVRRINFILKKRATRYIAAAEEEWLYPEQHASTTRWLTLDDDWFLLPNPYKVPFTSEIIVGCNDGTAFAMDEYGRNPGHPNFKDPVLHDRDWMTHQLAQRQWAQKRSVARLHMWMTTRATIRSPTTSCCIISPVRQRPVRQVRLDQKHHKCNFSVLD